MHIHSLLPNPSMQSLRILINLPKHSCLSSLRSISSLQRPFNFLNRGWEDETRALFGDRNRNPNPNPNLNSNLGLPELERNPNPSISTFYDPIQGNLVTKVNEEVPKLKDVEELETNRVLAEAKEDESRYLSGPNWDPDPNFWIREMEENRSPGIASIYDPTQGNLVTEDSEEEPKPKEKIKVPAVGKRRIGKTRVSWVCESCGAMMGQWWGSCPTCQMVGTVKQFSEGEVSKARGAEVSEAAVRSWLPQKAGEQVPQSLKEVNTGRNQSEWRIPLSGHFGMEVARVLGGGLVPGSLVLVGGDPGVGKSTLLLQLAAVIAEGHKVNGTAPVIYVSGEESIEQIGNRADRMRITTSALFLYSSTDIEDILDKIQALSPRAVIVDSIQTVYLKGVAGSAGNVMQVKECTSALLRFAKQTNIPVIVIGHVTKSGDIAGPRILEHIVDAVLYMEGERYSSYRLLRSVKNRFGSTDELGVFDMSESGLAAVSNPSEMFLTEHYSDSEVLVGLAVAVVVDGSRTFVIEIQALCVSDSSVSRHVNGVKESRAHMIIAVLMKQAGLKLRDSAIFLNVVSGFKLTETAGDLATAAAICSSFLEFPIPNDVAFIGEIGLGGELRTVPRMEKRVMAVAQLGYKRCVVPKTAEKTLTSLRMDMTIVGCRTLKEMINTIFQEG